MQSFIYNISILNDRMESFRSSSPHHPQIYKHFSTKKRNYIVFPNLRKKKREVSPFFYLAQAGKTLLTAIEILLPFKDIRRFDFS